ncbi:MAG TPA: site-2 protease family protein [Cyanobacteria bacterium UBA11149]|nr:site-2 protease family protein [Cyanobacteria bacterium UBA11366]HBK62455.1 site-2 protease family protein [Cyanobacteria bacterium UBA11166]HBR72605.1 site-2 protease family protein [Cyanobacteria bacterium UBA11159]HBS71176.1 site-2 protease family protein [Cyanobacteria bacterium UBA11153]HBW92338.1 site-2 protease family protein [Cyanobacteria bacterium UBA11149]HCA96376.1 site-2 protease family protein [Cyanobacteria bacterium UBA9226]
MLFETLLTNPIFFLRTILIVVISITLHELAHGFVALSQGDDTPKRTGHLTLNPVVHMGWESIIFLCLAGIAWGQMPINPARFRHKKISNILVSAAGPILNLCLGILFVILLNHNFSLSSGAWLSSEFLHLGAYINLSLFLFNLLPIPPLDGFHICSEFFPELKQLEHSPFGLLALAILFTGGFSDSLSLLVDGIICQFITSVGGCFS